MNRYVHDKHESQSAKSGYLSDAERREIGEKHRLKQKFKSDADPALRMAGSEHPVTNNMEVNHHTAAFGSDYGDSTTTQSNVEEYEQDGFEEEGSDRDEGEVEDESVDDEVDPEPTHGGQYSHFPEGDRQILEGVRRSNHVTDGKRKAKRSALLDTNSYPETTSGCMTVSTYEGRDHEEAPVHPKEYRQHEYEEHDATFDVTSDGQARRNYANAQIQDANLDYRNAQLNREQQHCMHVKSAKRKARGAEENRKVLHPQTIAANHQGDPRPLVVQNPMLQTSAAIARPTYPQEQQTGKSLPPSTTVKQTDYHKPPSAAVWAPAPQELAAQVEPEMLDYNLELLHKMSFEELCAESFDTKHPRSVLRSRTPEGSTLSEKLAVVAQANQEEQTQFLASLSTDNWEQTGAWFIDQFSVLMRKMQSSRQDRRKIAEGFEAEVKRRHEDVSKEGNHLEEAMKGMRRSGDAILHQSSPKRSKAPQHSRRRGI